VARLRFRPDVALVIVGLGLYIGAAAQVRSPRGSALAVALATASDPVIAAADAVTGAWADLLAGRESLRRTLAELTYLRREVGELRRTNQLLASEVAGLRQGSRLLAALPSLAQRAIVAGVTARDTLATNTVRLDRGRADGVVVDAAVVAANGVLGRVDVVASHSCRVQLLSHPAAAAAARILGVEGEELLVGGERPRLTGLPPYTKVPDGLTVVTTGSEGIYPPGLVLGTTSGAANQGLFTVVDVHLAVRPAEVDVVLVVSPGGASR
jgi:rod shape-determining protein MreC